MGTDLQATLGPSTLSLKKTKVMGIVNVTPDSFSDGGRFYDAPAAIRRAYQVLEDGANILDIGAESTRPGAAPLSDREEWRRLEPVLRELCANGVEQVSVDTYHPETAKRALDLGVHMINDVRGGQGDDAMLKVVAEAGCAYVWMHHRVDPPDGDGVDTLLAETRLGIQRCLAAGIRPESLWIDPGIGFGKTYKQNLAILSNLNRVTALNYPVLLGTSRKRFIGYALGLPVTDRLEGSLATVSIGVWQGVHAVRVHDVLESVRTCRMVEAIQYGQ